MRPASDRGCRLPSAGCRYSVRQSLNSVPWQSMGVRVPPPGAALMAGLDGSNGFHLRLARKGQKRLAKSLACAGQQRFKRLLRRAAALGHLALRWALDVLLFQRFAVVVRQLGQRGMD